ncbi:MAG: TIGR03960 family B12-binding radical SAM protein [Proteobacteria bacterium]|nr:TIGR03960 family B12-binding radical SAM protein [Pseudomonadota bacterium]
MIDHPYARFLAGLERPGRYVGGEFRAVDIPETADLRMVLAYPDSYEIGMSHIGLSVLYEIANALPGISCERVFMPWPDLESVLTEHSIPLLSLETARPLCEFDIIGFSLQYELNFTNLLAMLSLGGVPRSSKSRSDGDPIVLIGGPVAAHCEPIAPFVDLCLVGDGEEALPELLKEVIAAKKEGLGRGKLVARLHHLTSFFAPGLLDRFPDSRSKRVVVRRGKEPIVCRAVVSELGHHPTGMGPVPTVKAVFDRYSVEIARGCTSGCRFCQAGFTYRPVRERSESETLYATKRAVTCLGVDELSLAALSTADHSQIGPIISTLGDVFTPQRVSLSVPSLRAYGLPDELVEVLGRLRATGVTLAPEAGSQRMRDIVNKNITESDLLSAANRFFDRGFTRIKLYFMLGLPGETDEDLEEIVELAGRLRNQGKKRLGGRGPAITISVSTFVPKPFTPFEREGMIGLEEIRRKQAIIASAGRKKRLDVRFHNPYLSQLEGILCRGDSLTADLLEKAVDLGARFDGWDDMFNNSAWEEVLRDVDIPALIGQIPDDARLPWDHIDIGINPEFLQTERDRARAAETTQPCGRFGREAEVVCHSCGIACPVSSLPARSLPPIAEDHNGPPDPKPRGPIPRAVSQIDKGNPVRVRLFFAKWGRQAFVGHLDTMRHIVRSLRRSGLSLFYTKGFHPKPKVESAPPLALGTAGLREPIDVFLLDPPTEDEILELLKNSVPPDLEFVGVQKIPDGEKSLGKLIHGAEYVALVEEDAVEAMRGVESLISAQSIQVVRTRKGKTKQVDIRPFLIDAAVLDTQPPELRLPETRDRVPIAFSLNLPGSGGARPTEILETILGHSPSDPWIVRTRIIL